MVEGARLERVYRGNSIEGSNPSLTATFFPSVTDLTRFLLGGDCGVLKIIIKHLEAGLAAPGAAAESNSIQLGAVAGDLGGEAVRYHRTR